MVIISHRGYWEQPAEQNTEAAFERSFAAGFGVETDLRDYCGRLVIAHDIPEQSCVPADRFFSCLREVGGDVPVALNIKSDGLQKLVGTALRRYEIDQYFVFDMSVPDAARYVAEGLRVFTRQSEEERQPSFYREAAGVWIDGFKDDWVTGEVISQHLSNGKSVCIVSPELHNRDHLPLWERLAAARTVDSDRVMLCTDFPVEAKGYFDAVY